MAYQDIVYPKIPFYLTYPMQNVYMTEMEYEKDLDYSLSGGTAASG